MQAPTWFPQVPGRKTPQRAQLMDNPGQTAPTAVQVVRVWDWVSGWEGSLEEDLDNKQSTT